MSTGFRGSSGRFQVHTTHQDLINSGDAFKKTMNEQFSSDKSATTFRKSRRQSQSRLSECCYSISNLALIVVCVIALVVLVQFIQDDPLYDYSEHLLTISFYRQLIYCLVIVPLVLLVPFYNALSVFVLHPKEENAYETGNKQFDQQIALVYVKLFAQFILIILVLLALVFVAPFMGTQTLASSIELELRKHMKYRYENEFSYEFLDRIQEAYECCDELWYRANMHDHLPSSCFVPNTNFARVYTQTCPAALATIISLRCSVLAACLLAMLAALVGLFVVDLLELCELRADRLRATTSKQLGAFETSSATSNVDTQTASRRLQLEERLSELPLLSANYATSFDTSGERAHSEPLVNGVRELNQQIAQDEFDREVDDDDETRQDYNKHRQNNTPPIVLARANYHLVRRERSQSPQFQSAPIDSGEIESVDRAATKQVTMPLRSALKKTPSSASSSRNDLSENFITDSNEFKQQDNNDDDNDDGISLSNRSLVRRLDEEEDANSLDEYANRLRQSDSLLRDKLQRDQQTRRSLLSVRFAE